MLALRYLRAKRQDGYVSVISGFSLVGIALGVATLIIVMSVMGGFRKEFLASILGFNGHVTVEAAAGPLPNFDAIVGKLKAVPGVTRAAPIVDGQVMASQNGVNTGIYIRGMRPAGFGQPQQCRPHSDAGRAQGVRQRRHGDHRRGPGRKTGHPPRRLDHADCTASGEVTRFRHHARIKTYLVAGVFKIGNSAYDSGFVFMPLDEAQLFFDTGDGVTGIEVMVQKPDNDIAMLPDIARAAGPGVRLVPWQDINSAFFEAVQVESNVMFLILTLIILVAALNIVSGLIMLVKDKSSDIAILRTMGASRAAVMRVFLIAGMAIGVTGTLLGFVLGVVFCWEYRNHPPGPVAADRHALVRSHHLFPLQDPADLDPGRWGSVVAMALGLTFLATLYPSWRAARLDPVEALRYG